MPMVVYTEDEVIEKCEKAGAEAAAEIASERDRLMTENTTLRRKLNDYRDAMKTIADDPDISTDAAVFARQTVKRLG